MSGTGTEEREQNITGNKIERSSPFFPPKERGCETETEIEREPFGLGTFPGITMISL